MKTMTKFALMLAAASTIATTNVFAALSRVDQPVQAAPAKTEVGVALRLMHDAAISTATFSADGNSVLMIPANNNRVVKLYRMQRGGQGLQLISMFNHDGRVISARFDDSGTRAITIADDGIERQWDVVGGRQLSTRPVNYGQER